MSDFLSEQAAKYAFANTVGRCPDCGRNVIKGKKSYFCSGYTEKAETGKPVCSFGFRIMISGTIISDSAATKLLIDGISPKLTFWDKSGGNFKSFLCITKDEKTGCSSVSFSPFASNAVGICPVCKRAVKEGKKVYYCEGFLKKYADGKPLCPVMIKKNMFGVSITQEDLSQFLNTGKISDKKVPGAEPIHFEMKKNYYGKDSLLCVIGTCPKCKKKIIANSKGYFCETADCVRIYKEKSGSEISLSEAQRLLKGETLPSRQCTFKNGSKKTVSFKLDTVEGMIEIIW